MRQQYRFTLFVNPVPASRPRFVNRGRFVSTYYAGPYKKFKEVDGIKALEPVIKKLTDLPITTDCEVEVRFFVRRPKTTKLNVPKPDIDNYLKALLDLLQPSILSDDKLVTKVTADKQWTTQTPRIEVLIHTS